MTPSSFCEQILLTLRTLLRLATLLTCVSIGTTTVLFCQMRCGASTKDIRPMWRGVCVRERVCGWVCAYVYLCVRVSVCICICVYAAWVQRIFFQREEVCERESVCVRGCAHMCMYVCVYMCIYVSVCIRREYKRYSPNVKRCVCERERKCVCGCVHMCMYLCMYICICVYAARVPRAFIQCQEECERERECVFVWVHAYVYIYVHVYVYVCMRREYHGHSS